MLLLLGFLWILGSRRRIENILQLRKMIIESVNVLGGDAQLKLYIASWQFVASSVLEVGTGKELTSEMLQSRVDKSKELVENKN